MKEYSAHRLSESSRLPTTNQSVSLSDPDNPFSIQTLTETSLIKGKTSQSLYDGSNRTWVHLTPEGRQTSIKTDVYEKPTELQVGNFTPISMSYTDDGRISSIEQGKRKTAFKYDGYGYLSESINALNQKTKFHNDINGRRVASITPDGRQSKFEYDKNGNLISITPPSKPKHSFVLNAFEKLREYLPPALGGNPVKTQYQYDRDQNIKKIIRPDGQEVIYSYGVHHGRIEKIETPQGDFEMSHSAATNDVADSKSPDNISIYYIDHHGPVRSQEVHTLSSTNSSLITLKRTFDDEHRVSSLVVQHAAGNSISTVSYDKDDLVIKSGLMSYERNHAQGNITKQKLYNAEISHAFDSTYGELESIKSLQNKKQNLNINYRRDLLGRISYEEKHGLGEYLIYDESGRYLGRRPFGSHKLSHEYKYDKNSNRVWSKTPEGEVTATYDAQDRLTTWGNLEFDYNENGDLTSKIETSSSDETLYSYDVFGNLKSVTLPNEDVIQYEIDGDQRRVVKKLNGTFVTRFLYDGQLRVIAELNSSRVLTKRYVYSDSPNVPDYMEFDGKRYIFVKDIRGSVLKVVDSQSGTIAQEMEYDDWGKVTSDTNPGFQPFGFAGGLYDHQTKLVRFGARDYDGETGRWTTKDPIRFDGGDTNLYGYVMQDPVNFIDVKGTNLVAVGRIVGVILDITTGLIDIAAVCVTVDSCRKKFMEPEPPLPKKRPDAKRGCNPLFQSCQDEPKIKCEV